MTVNIIRCNFNVAEDCETGSNTLWHGLAPPKSHYALLSNVLAVT